MTLKLPSPLNNLLRTVKSALVQRVPDSTAPCEFDCPRHTCSDSRWQQCPRRQSNNGQGHP